MTEKQNSNLEYVEFKEVKQNILINTDSIVSKNLLYETNLKFPLLSIDLDKLYKEYFTYEFNEFSILKLEKMFNDFKIILRLVDSFIKAYKNSDIPNRSYNKKMVNELKEKEKNTYSNNLLDL